MTDQQPTFWTNNDCVHTAQVLVENVTLAIVPLVAGEPNRAHACLGSEALVKCVLVVTALCSASWICHIMYYKVCTIFVVSSIETPW